MNNNILKIIDLQVNLLEKEKFLKNILLTNEKKSILKDFNLTIKKNEIHVIMGPNGCGKSTLFKTLAGHPGYIIEKGEIYYLNHNINILSSEERAHKGLFLAFQYPPEISGVTTYDFLNFIYNEHQKYLGYKEINPIEFLEKINNLLKKLKISEEFLNRYLNEGFSGGEKKRNEILQLLLLQPKLILLDEIDSGLDIDTLKLICKTIKENFLKDSSIIIITHNSNILNYITPNYIHLMLNGKIYKTGTKELSKIIEKEGYNNFY